MKKLPHNHCSWCADVYRTKFSISFALLLILYKICTWEYYQNTSYLMVMRVWIWYENHLQQQLFIAILLEQNVVWSTYTLICFSFNQYWIMYWYDHWKKTSSLIEICGLLKASEKNVHQRESFTCCMLSKILLKFTYQS